MGHSTWLSKCYKPISVITKNLFIKKRDQILATLSQIQDIYDTFFKATESIVRSLM